jgi:FixJ family two-component response regulator
VTSGSSALRRRLGITGLQPKICSLALYGFNVARPAPKSVASRDLLKLSTVCTIIIIDDDELLREAMECLVQTLGYDVRTFASAEEYLRSGCVRESSCVITDVQMPGMTGIDLLARLTADGYRIPVILVSGSPEEELRSRAMKSGAIGFLQKPFDIEALAVCLRRALKG